MRGDRELPIRPMRPLLILTLLLLAAASCVVPPDDSAEPGEVVEAPGEPVETPAANAGDPVRTRAASTVEPAFVPVDPDCEFVARPAHDDPDALIAEFLERDARGEFLRTEDWLPRATTCPGHEPGPDTYTVIATYSTEVVSREPSRLAVEVTSQRLGYRDVRGFDADPGVEVDTVTAVLTPYGWRIESPALRQYVIEN